MRRGERIPLHDHSDDYSGGLVAAHTVVSLGSGGTDGVTSGGGSGASPGSSVVAETSFGLSSAVGTASTYARSDHTHGTPADPTASASSVWMPLTTVVGGLPELVWDADDSLIPTLSPL